MEYQWVVDLNGNKNVNILSHDINPMISISWYPIFISWDLNGISMGCRWLCPWPGPGPGPERWREWPFLPGYYDNTNFHRNIKGFMIQAGSWVAHQCRRYPQKMYQNVVSMVHVCFFGSVIPLPKTSPTWGKSADVGRSAVRVVILRAPARAVRASMVVTLRTPWGDQWTAGGLRRSERYGKAPTIQQWWLILSGKLVFMSVRILSILGLELGAPHFNRRTSLSRPWSTREEVWLRFRFFCMCLMTALWGERLWIFLKGSIFLGIPSLFLLTLPTKTRGF